MSGEDRERVRAPLTSRENIPSASAGHSKPKSSYGPDYPKGEVENSRPGCQYPSSPPLYFLINNKRERDKLCNNRIVDFSMNLSTFYNLQGVPLTDGL